MNKLLLMIMFVGATFGAYEPDELAERKRVRQDVANFLKWEQQNEEEERIEKENIKRMMDQFFLKEEFDAFQKKNQKNTENILDRLNDLEEKNRLKNEELLKLQKDNERKNETILNLQGKVDELKNELFKKFDALNDEVLKKGIPAKEDDETDKELGFEKIFAFDGYSMRSNPINKKLTEEFVLKTLKKIKNKEQLEFFANLYDSLFPIKYNSNQDHELPYLPHDLNTIENHIKFKSLGMYSLSKIKNSKSDKFCNIINNINNVMKSKIINPSNLDSVCNLNIEQLEVLEKITNKFSKIGFYCNFEKLFIVAKNKSVNDLKEIEHKISDIPNDWIGHVGSGAFNIWLDSLLYNRVVSNNDPNLGYIKANMHSLLHETKYAFYKKSLNFTDIIKSLQ